MAAGVFLVVVRHLVSTEHKTTHHSAPILPAPPQSIVCMMYDVSMMRESTKDERTEYIFYGSYGNKYITTSTCKAHFISLYSIFQNKFMMMNDDDQLSHHSSLRRRTGPSVPHTPQHRIERSDPIFGIIKYQTIRQIGRTQIIREFL